MRNDFLTTIFFWILCVIVLCFFSWTAFEELMALQIQQEHDKVMFEFNEKIRSGIYNGH